MTFLGPPKQVHGVSFILLASGELAMSQKHCLEFQMCANKEHKLTILVAVSTGAVELADVDDLQKTI